MPYANGAQGVRIHYRVIGDKGPVTILLHGLGLSGRFWFSLPGLLGGRVIVMDNRGTGHSDCPGRPWKMAHMADDALAVLDAAGAKTAVVAGISMGGMIAQHLTLRHPDRVTGLVLMATSAGLPHARFPGLGTLKNLVSLPLIDEEEAGRRLARLLLPKSELPRAREHLSGWREALLEEAAKPRSFFYQLGAVMAHSTGFRLKRIKCPTVVLVGAQDALVPPKNSRILHKLIPGSHLEMLPHVGHGIEILDKEAIRRAVERAGGKD